MGAPSPAGRGYGGFGSQPLSGIPQGYGHLPGSAGGYGRPDQMQSQYGPPQSAGGYQPPSQTANYQPYQP